MASPRNHVGRGAIDQLKETKKEIENKVPKILKLVKNNGQDKKGKILEDSKKRSEIIGFIEDLHKQYQSLYAQYDHLREEMGKNASSRKEKGNSSPTSMSDSEYFSSDEIDNVIAMNNTDVEVAVLQQRLASVIAEKEALNAQYVSALRKIKETEAVTKDLRNKSEKDEPEKSSTLVKVQDMDGSRASAQIKELEGQLTTLKIELESLRGLKKNLEGQIEKKATETMQFGEKNKQLQARITELESMSKEKGDEISAILKKQKDNEDNLTSKIQELRSQVSNLQMEVDSLLAQKDTSERNKRNEESAKVKGFKDQVIAMQQELNKKTTEIAEKVILIETLKDDMVRKTIFEEGLLKEKEGFLVQIEDLELELLSLRNQKTKLEDLMKTKSRETDQLKEKNERLHTKIQELEGIIVRREDELSTFQKEYESKENEASTQIVALEAQVSGLQQELVSSLSEKTKLEMQNERLKLDGAQSQIQMENEILSLTSKISDQQKVIKEQEETIKKHREEHKLTKHHSLDSPRHRSLDSSKLNHNFLERKVDELAAKFQMKMENHMRILCQRILVAEQTQAETKYSFKKILDSLNNKIASYESSIRKMTEILLEPGNNILTGFDFLVRKLDEDNGKLLNRISKISNELQFAKRWIVETNNEMKRLKQNEGSLKEEVWRLEAMLRRQEEGNNAKLHYVSQLEKKLEDYEQQLRDKDEVLIDLGEQKREAIRQLCALIDYHRDRYNHLKEEVSRRTAVRVK